MTPALRIWHRRIWLTLGIILPLLFLAAVMALPKHVQDKNTVNNIPEALPQILVTVSSELIHVNVRLSETAEQRQIEITLRKALTVPECLVYLSCGETENVFLGKLSSIGTYRFTVGEWALEQCTLSCFNPFSNRSFHTVNL